MSAFINNDELQVVVGLGQSGLSAVNYLIHQGYQVAVSDGNPAPSLAEKLPDSVTMRQFGDIDEALLLKASRIVISPGISLEQPAVAQAIKAGIKVVSDIQLFHEAVTEREASTGKRIPIIAITGSNAKSTVTTLVGEMAKDAGIAVGVGGNIGVPALSLLDTRENDTEIELVVLELSSFQLETVSNLPAQVATVLNMSPDHLDRHGDMVTYQQLKHRIFDNAHSVVINREDALTLPKQAIEVVRSVGSDEAEGDNFGLITQTDGQVYLAKGTNKLINTNDLKIKGQHNQINALSALALGELAGLPMDSMLKTLQRFAGLEHRCQFIATVQGVDYFNDSKGTNIGSTMAAIKGLGESYTTTNPTAKLALILGGQGKGQDFSEMVALIKQFVGYLYFIGEDGKLIEQQLVQGGLQDSLQAGLQGGLTEEMATRERPVQRVQIGTLDKAIEAVAQLISEDSQTDIHAVLLSPACASFDQFTSYTKRGERFVALVEELQK